MVALALLYWLSKGKEPANQRTDYTRQMTDNKKLAKKEKLSSIASQEPLPEPSAAVMPKAGSNVDAQIAKH